MSKETFHIRLETRNEDKGYFRAYSIDAAQNLFGHWLINVSFGRIGKRGRTLTYSLSDDQEASRIVRHCLQLRATVTCPQ